MNAALAAPVIDLFDYVEAQLAAIYRFTPHVKAKEFLFSQERFVKSSDTLSLPRASVFLKQDQDDLEIGIYFDASILETLTEHTPLKSGVTPHNLDAFCVLIEELSHFHLLINRASWQQEVSLLELEWQGEIDKVMLSAALVYQQTGVNCLKQLVGLIFEQSTIESPDQDLYERASYYAAKYWHQLLATPSAKSPKPDYEKLAGNLRQTYRQHWSSKIRFIHQK